LKKRNLLAFLFSIPAGMLLFIKGIQGPTDFYFLLLQYVSSLLNAGIIRSLLMVGLLFLIVLSSLGGLTVIVGGFFIYKNRVSFGKFLIGMGAGISVFFVFVLLIPLFSTGNVLSIFNQYSVLGWIGLLLAFLARFIVK